MYRQDASVDLTLTVSELLDVHTGSWNRTLVRQLIAEEDVEIVLNTKLSMSHEDKLIWGLAKNGRYDAKSGYKLTDLLLNLQTPNRPQQPPLERQLWTNLWRMKAPPKLKHFLWRVNSGALAVKTQLRTRGIQVDPLCSVCGQGAESICHVLFHCQTAKEVWELSSIPSPPAGWSQSSVFLNLYHLIKCSKITAIGACSRQSFPWILWHLWKARNAFCYENQAPVSSVIFQRASEDAAIWLNLHKVLPKVNSAEGTATNISPKWQKPSSSFLKCNVAASWDASTKTGGGAWVVRDKNGTVLVHSRKAFFPIGSLSQANLAALQWAASAMKDLKYQKVIIESSSQEVEKAMNHPLLSAGDYQLVPTL